MIPGNLKNGKFTIGQAIQILNPLAEISNDIQDNGEELFDTIVWHNGNSTNITKEQVDTKLAEMQADYDAKEYQRLRKPEYPTIDELVVALYDSDDKTAIDEKRAEIKLKYPKPVA